MGSNDRRLFTQFDSIEISEADAAAICGNLSGHYVNYHSDEHPGGRCAASWSGCSR
jgi:hypothetical protein